DTETTHSGEWRPEFLDIIRRYEPPRHYFETHEMVAQLAAQGLIGLVGEERTVAVAFDQSVDDYLRLLGSTSTFSRVSLGSRADAFEAECREVFARHGLTRIRSAVVTSRPRTRSSSRRSGTRSTRRPSSRSASCGSRRRSPPRSRSSPPRACSRLRVRASFAAC